MGSYGNDREKLQAAREVLFSTRTARKLNICGSNEGVVK